MCRFFRSFEFDATQRIASARQVRLHECDRSLYIFQGGKRSSAQRCLRTQFPTPVPRGSDSDASRKRPCADLLKMNSTLTEFPLSASPPFQTIPLVDTLSPWPRPCAPINLSPSFSLSPLPRLPLLRVRDVVRLLRC